MLVACAHRGEPSHQQWRHYRLFPRCRGLGNGALFAGASALLHLTLSGESIAMVARAFCAPVRSFAAYKCRGEHLISFLHALWIIAVMMRFSTPGEQRGRAAVLILVGIKMMDPVIDIACRPTLQLATYLSSLAPSLVRAFFLYRDDNLRSVRGVLHDMNAATARKDPQGHASAKAFWWRLALLPLFLVSCWRWPWLHDASV